MSVMASMEGVLKGSGKKRKHEDEGTPQDSPAKKSKSGRRNERRRERLEANAAERKDRRVSLGEHKVKARSSGDIKRERRKRQREAVAAGLPVASVIRTAPPDHDAADDHHSEEIEKVNVREDWSGRRKPKKKKKAKRTKASEHGTIMPSSTKGKLQKQQEDGQQQEQQLLSLTPKAPARLTVSDVAAGRFLDHDPLFMRDASGEEYIIAAVARELQVLSVQTSLLVRTLPAQADGTILGFAAAPSVTKLVYIADSKGGILEWDWSSELPARSVGPLSGDFKALAATFLDNDNNEEIFPYITQVGGRHVVKVQGGDFKTKYSLDSIQVLDKAHYILARGPRVVVIGARKDDNDYAWVELPLTKPATCMDARVISPPTPGSKKAYKRHHHLQLAIGNDNGQIQLYDDISSLLSQAQPALPAPRVLHWHRSAVSSVKFSPDGSYLISGGKETVLVLWQLETGKKQYLPHLMSEIERISVNALGDRYALQMGDNSIMVLSTAELRPVANFAGLQIQTVGRGSPASPAACLQPKDSRQLMLTVPESRPESTSEAAPRPFLQTFDLRSSRHVTRQALTRTNATDRNTGPDGQPILVPDVRHLAVSWDGEWLATVDEWMPPAWDLSHITSDPAGLEEARKWYRQVFLKFWQWDASLQLWALSSRADDPHQRAGLRSRGAGRVMALVSDPARNAFSTVGEDGCVKIWRPKTRLRGGVAMKDAQDVPLKDWTCKHSVQLLSSQQRASLPNSSGTAAAYSDDGSLLAVSTTAPTTMDESLPAIALIETATGKIQSVRTDLSDGMAVEALAFLERYLITVTPQTTFVWNLVSRDLMNSIKVPHRRGVAPQIAVSSADQIFALITPAERERKASRLTIYSTREERRLFEQEFKTEIVKILSSAKSREFVLLFADATVRTVSLAGALSRVGGPAAAEALRARAVSIPEAVGSVRSAPVLELEEEEAGATSFSIERDEDNRPVVTPEQLEVALGVVDGAAMPPVRNMFRGVMKLFARKPI